MPMDKDACLACRHTLDSAMVDRLADLMSDLPGAGGPLLEGQNIDPQQYDALFRAAVEKLRGSFAASVRQKKRFIEAILSEMNAQGLISGWGFIGGVGRQDYRVTLQNGRNVAIEGKGCPDGNNMNIWDVPPWADEVIVWSQCPESLAKQPGAGVWSGISTRLVKESVANNKKVDAMIFFDGRCGSASRHCPKRYGIDSGLRPQATDIPGQQGNWVPPPCIYLFPRTVAHPQQNREPALHDLTSCQFAAALLTVFSVPSDQQPHEVHWVRVAASQESDGTYLRTRVGWDLDDSTPDVDSGWKKLRR